ncbi:translocation/assembly module TamB domain-containing protein, partial [Phenylobacterium sp.]|uniref:translocation/assembly module TamB domain-containing protein n=1 Tax=Phenylobacterium sp. TaxID=1871053 RepID=UPI003982E269
MTDAPDTTTEAAIKRGIPRALVAILVGVAVVLAGLLGAGRYGVLLPQARLLIEARTDGLKIGRLGRLKIEGLSGDVLRDFTIRRLTVRDEQGVWLEANNVHMRWRSGDLLRRRFHAERIEAQNLRLLRRPTLTPKGKDQGLPVSFHITEARTRVEMAPAFSYRAGVYDLALALDVERRGGQQGRVRAASVLHAGDYLNVDFDLSRTRPLKLVADALEARGGALAGALGLPVDQPFVLKIVAGGQMSKGRFTAIARTGAATPLSAQGTWTPDGGRADGRLSLAASALTARHARRFGPEAVFSLSGRKAQASLFDLDGRIASENLTVSARGQGNLWERRLGPAGLSLDVRTGALSRIVGGPSLGAARVNGALTGKLVDWRFAGRGVVSDASLGGYGLSQAGGPLQVAGKAGAIAVKADLTGAGGRGDGWVAAMLGAAPRAKLDGERLADGRLLLRDLAVTGRGLKVQASGARGVLGGLSFKGRADLSNLAEARRGAAGAAQVTWSASQGRAGQPWSITLDARGERFATGYAELDRLLGARPQLKAQGALQGGRVAVARAELNGAALNATTSGALAADRSLAFTVDWSASGPFRAGPVEIAGKARGAGSVTGSLSAPQLDLTADVDAIDLPRLPLTNAKLSLSFLRRAEGSSGVIAVRADSAHGPAVGRSAFRFPGGGVDLTDLTVDAGGMQAQGALSLRSRSPSSADLQIVMTPGAFLAAGRLAGTVRIVDAAGGARATLNLTGENTRLPGTGFAARALRITADGPLARLPYAAQAQGASPRGPWAFDGRGVLAQAQPGYALSFDGTGRLGDRNLRTVETATARFGGPERSARLRLAASDGGRIDLNGRLGGDLAEVRAQVAGLGLGLLDPDLAGRFDATFALQGRGQRLDGTMNARLAGARGRGAPAASGIDGVVQARLADSQILLDAQATNAQGLRANANLVLPAESSASPFRVAIARQRPLRGKFFAEGEVSPLWDLLVGGERSLSGRVRTEGILAGTLADPSASGQIAVDAGRFDDGASGLSLRNVSLRAGFVQSAVNVTEASGVDGRGGSVTGAGRISLLRDGVSSFRLDLKGFRLIDNDQATASATGQATIDRGANGKVRLAGALTIDRADVAADLPQPSGVVAMDVIEKNRPEALAVSLPEANRRGQGWALDVTLTAPRRVFLRGRGLDVELSLDARVQGTTSRPELSGTARVVRGDYDFAGKRFEFDTQSVVFLSTRPQNIRLQLTATRDDPSLTAAVRIRGTAARPDVTLTSVPALPNDEVLSQVLFGRSASQLPALEAAQLASALAALSGGGGLDVIGN